MKKHEKMPEFELLELKPKSPKDIDEINAEYQKSEEATHGD